MLLIGGTMKQQDTYHDPIIIKGEGYVAKVYKPILTEEERARRMKKIEQSAARLLASLEKE
ncbi:MAG: hypothetical protein II304_05620 [Bacteroidales bacterium]|nr:hypothetical protein [Bacteroidales bacterium]